MTLSYMLGQSRSWKVLLIDCACFLMGHWNGVLIGQVCCTGVETRNKVLCEKIVLLDGQVMGEVDEPGYSYSTCCLRRCIYYAEGDEGGSGTRIPKESEADDKVKTVYIWWEFDKGMDS